MSDKTLDKLISTLKTEAIEAAEKEAAAIRTEAKKYAKELLAETRAKCDHMIEEAKVQAAQTLEKGNGALRQAARDVSVTLQQELLELMGRVLEQEVSQQLSASVVETAVLKALENVGSGVELKLSDDLIAELGDKLQQTLQGSETFITNYGRAGVLKNVTISKKAEGWSYHISPETVSELLKAQLGKSWRDLIEKA